MSSAQKANGAVHQARIPNPIAATALQGHTPQPKVWTRRQVAISARRESSRVHQATRAQLNAKTVRKIITATRRGNHRASLVGPILIQTISMGA